MTSPAAVVGVHGQRVRRLEWLDLVRGVASIAVVVYHYRLFLGIQKAYYLYLSVDVFFVLSGIVLGLRYTDVIRSGMSFTVFAAARVRRLYPMVLIAALLTTAVALAMSPADAPGRDRIELARVFLVWPSFDDAQATGFLLNAPLWSLWAELVANAAWFVAVRRGHVWSTALGVASFVVMVGFAWQANTMDLGAGGGTAARLASVTRALAWFSVGCGIALGSVRRVVSPLAACGWWASAAALAALVLHVAWLNQLLVAATAAAVLQVLYLAPAPPVSMRRLCFWLGQTSFPLYLVHSPCKPLVALVALAGGLPHAVAAVLVLGVVTVAATVANEQLVGYVQRFGRPSRRER